MLNLADHQFEILPSENASEGVGFGIGLDISLEAEGFHPGALSWATQDSENTRDGSTAFGRDRLTGPTWGWDLFTNRADKAGARESLSKIARAWRAEEIRDIPGAVLPVRYRLDDDVRRIYGRPRNFDAPPNNLILSGLVPITCDFKCADSLIYDDAPSSAVVGSLAANSGGGFTFPAVFPVSTAPPSESVVAGAIRVGGDAATYPVIRFTGGGAGPWVQVSTSKGDWTLSVDATFGALDYIEIDLRSWARTVLMNGTRNLAGKVGRRQWLPDMKLEPGEAAVRTGASAGEPTCTLSWRNAWTSI